MLGTMPVQTNGGTHRLGWRNQQLNHAHEQGYLVIIGRNQAWSSAWREHCQAHRMPFVRIRFAHQSGGYATVYVDLEPAQLSLPPETQTAIHWLCSLVAQGHFLCGQDSILCNKVPSDVAERFAWVLLRVLNDCLRLNQQDDTSLV